MKFLSSLVAASAALLSVADLSSAAPNKIRSSIACNNSPDLCDRNYNDVTYLGAHDSAFLRDSSTSFSDAGDQFYNATMALSAGVRLLQAQVHNLKGTLELCHTLCSLLDGGSLQSFLLDIKSWMDGNPNEVVTLLLVNSDNNATDAYGSVFEASGISKYGYAPPAQSPPGPITTWPTLQTLITANTRLVTFIANIDTSATYPYLLNEFTYAFETAFSVTSPSNFSCVLDRPSTLSSAASAVSAGYLPLINHFLDTVQAFGIQVPDINNIMTSNSPTVNVTGSLGTHLNQCANEYGIKPTFVLVDFWNVAGPITAVDQLNGISGATGRTTVSQVVLTSGANILEGWSTLSATTFVLLTVAWINFVCL